MHGLVHPVIITLLFCIVVPLGLIGWLAFGRPQSRVGAGVHVLATASFIADFHVSQPSWSIVGVWMPWVLWGLFAAALMNNVRRARRERWLPRGWRAWLDVAILLGVSVVFLIRLSFIARSRSFHSTPIALAFPLRGGTFQVNHGGSEAITNQHHESSAQTYALDIVQLNGLGMRAKGIMPKDLTAYAIFGTPVYAPCAGEVLLAEDKLEDQIPPELPARRDDTTIAGNFVVLGCGDTSVLLAHFKHGSVAVSTGARVAEGDLLGAVGNTGNTAEPHLHIHAVRGAITSVDQFNVTADPVPMTFDGRFLVRNDRVTR